MDISEANLDEHCYLNTVKEGKTTFSILDQKRVEAVRILQERCGFPSDEDFINALECNSIEGVDFGRREVNIANEIYGYSKGAAMGRFKHPHKGMKMDKTTEDITTPLPPKIPNPILRGGTASFVGRSLAGGGDGTVVHSQLLPFR